MKKLRRNTVVRAKEGGWFYGRVSRRIDDEHVEVICSGAHITVYRDDELDDCSDYKGYQDYHYGRCDENGDRIPKKWVHMTSLRRLKQQAAFYDRKAWKRFRHLDKPGGHRHGSMKNLARLRLQWATEEEQ